MKIHQFILCSLLVCLTSISLIGCKQKAKYEDVSDKGFYNPDSIVMVDTLSEKPEGDYELTNYDTPPTPVNNPLPEYPQAFRDSGIQGVVVLEVQISNKGVVEDAKVTKSLLSGEGGLDETAIAAVKQWSFKPAIKNKRAVAATVNIPIPFSLKQ